MMMTIVMTAMITTLGTMMILTIINYMTVNLKTSCSPLDTRGKELATLDADIKQSVFISTTCPNCSTFCHYEGFLYPQKR